MVAARSSAAARCAACEVRRRRDLAAGACTVRAAKLGEVACRCSRRICTCASLCAQPKSLVRDARLDDLPSPRRRRRLRPRRVVLADGQAAAGVAELEGGARAAHDGRRGAVVRDLDARVPGVHVPHFARAAPRRARQVRRRAPLLPAGVGREEKGAAQGGPAAAVGVGGLLHAPAVLADRGRVEPADRRRGVELHRRLRPRAQGARRRRAAGDDGRDEALPQPGLVQLPRLRRLGAAVHAGGDRRRPRPRRLGVQLARRGRRGRRPPRARGDGGALPREGGGDRRRHGVRDELDGDPRARRREGTARASCGLRRAQPLLDRRRRARRARR